MCVYGMFIYLNFRYHRAKAEINNLAGAVLVSSYRIALGAKLFISAFARWYLKLWYMNILYTDILYMRRHE